MPQDRNHQIAYFGTLMLMVGVFLPLASIPIVGDITYYRVNNMGAILVALFALSAPVLIVQKKPKLTFISAAGAWIILLWPAIKNIFSGSGDDGGLLGKITKKAADPLADFAGDMFMQLDTFSWGGFIFLLGLLVLTVGCILTTRAARN